MYILLVLWKVLELWFPQAEHSVWKCRSKPRTGPHCLVLATAGYFSRAVRLTVVNMPNCNSTSGIKFVGQLSKMRNRLQSTVLYTKMFFNNYLLYVTIIAILELTMNNLAAVRI